MQVLPLKTSLIKPNDDLVTILIQAVKKQRVKLKDGDILAISSKAVASADGRIVKMKTVAVSKRAEELARKHSLEPEFVELVLREADKVYGGVEKAILTLKDNALAINAGIDHKNVPTGYAALWPSNPQRRAESLHKEIRRRIGKDVGVLLVDSSVAPLRIGTRGVAIGVAGFKPTKDCRGKRDLFQKPLLITQHAVADDLASAAHLVMGQANERTPAALIRGAPATFVGKTSIDEMKISPDKCVYITAFHISTKRTK
jgi:coenzyme F420-0:L-glutamate ligase/coenzyme F420-1:gamma-L-glutamate ligase